MKIIINNFITNKPNVITRHINSKYRTFYSSKPPPSSNPPPSSPPSLSPPPPPKRSAPPSIPPNIPPINPPSSSSSSSLCSTLFSECILCIHSTHSSISLFDSARNVRSFFDDNILNSVSDI
eukprot:395965_1